MKKLLASLLATCLAVSAAAQKTNVFTADKTNEYGLTYVLPITGLKITVTAQQTVKKAGPYYKYAQKYLGTTNVVTADEQTWDLTAVEVEAVGIPNETHRYLMQFKSGQPVYILKSDDGVLLAVNSKQALTPVTKAVETERQVAEATSSFADLSALPAELLASTSVAKQAEVAALQIYKIRQSRNDYITGEAEQMPDGEALKLILQQLDRQEQALVNLFVGTTSTAQATRQFDFLPDNNDITNAQVCRISDVNGISDSNDLSGEPLYLSMKVVGKPQMPVNEKGEPKKMPKDAVIYNIPGKAEFTFTYDGNEVNRCTFDLAQLGIQFGLDPSLFSSKKQPAFVQLSPTTGAIVELGTASE